MKYRVVREVDVYGNKWYFPQKRRFLFFWDYFYTPMPRREYNKASGGFYIESIPDENNYRVSFSTLEKAEEYLNKKPGEKFYF